MKRQMDRKKRLATWPEGLGATVYDPKVGIQLKKREILISKKNSKLLTQGCTQKYFLRYTPITESKRAILYHFKTIDVMHSTA